MFLQKQCSGVNTDEEVLSIREAKLRVVAERVGLRRLHVLVPHLKSLILDGSALTSLRDLGIGLVHLKVCFVNIIFKRYLEVHYFVIEPTWSFSVEIKRQPLWINIVGRCVGSEFLTRTSRVWESFEGLSSIGGSAKITYIRFS